MNPLYPAVVQALTVMLSRNLSNSPSADEIPEIAEVMAADLTIFGYQIEHVQDIDQALAYLGRTQDQWPTVKQVRDAIQEAARARMMQRPRLPAPEISEERRQYWLAKLRSLTRGLRDSMSPPYLNLRRRISAPQYDEGALLGELERRKT